MPLQKQPIQINFAQGLDTKTDPKQVPVGRFAALENSVFDKGGMLKKRNGYKNLAGLPDSYSTFATTFNGNLTAIGVDLNAYSSGSNTWVNKGALKPALLDTLPLIRSSTNQSQADSAVAPNGLVCTVYTDVLPDSPFPATIDSYKFAIADSVTGQNIVAPQAIVVSSGAVSGSPRVFVLGSHFIIVFTNGTSLQYITINTNNPTTPTLETTISSQYTPSSGVAFDGVVANNNLYLAWNGSDVGGAIRMVLINSNLVASSATTFPTYSATLMSVCADTSGSTPVIYAAFYDDPTQDAWVLAVSNSLVTIFSPVSVIISPSYTVTNITCTASDMSCDIFWEVESFYNHALSIPNNIIRTSTVSQAGAVTSFERDFMLGLGLASKAFTVESKTYLLTVYQSTNQSTYFLLDTTGPDIYGFGFSGNVVAKLAYSNAKGYYTTGLPNITVNGNVAQVPYLIKDFITTVTKDNTASNTSTIYTQTGINLATFTIGTSNLSTAEIGDNLNISGGFIWSYDGVKAVEQGFFLWPDAVTCIWSATGGSMAARPDGITNTNAYFYQATYEWSDNQGNIFRSAPSIPVAVTTTGSGTAGSVLIEVPTLRLSYKPYEIKIVIYRWSVANQTYRQVTFVTSPVLNHPGQNSVQFVDDLSDAQIAGNSVLYTTGGVVENIGPPAVSSMTLFKSRLFAVDSENKNLLWYSKQVIEGTPVEMSDLFTLYVAPTTSAAGSTGPITALSAMDDKLIVFKEDAIYYIVGTGPDNTGANNDFSEPVFITSTVGCNNQQSIVFMPQGLMFQSSKGIWLLGRDLSTTYIGAPVEDFNTYAVQSAVNVPATNQVRFTLSNGATLMYDYYFGQWGTFTGVPAVSSTIYQGLHTFINSLGAVYQETPNLYLDGSRPVLMSFKTGPINTAGIQGFERAYQFFFIGEYKSPHKLSLSMYYDYNPSPEQTSFITPQNFNYTYGGASLYGGDGYGGNPTLEQWQVYFRRQKCQAFQISVSESYDASYGVAAGAGFTLSGLTMLVGIKGASPKIKAALSVG
jgi:hypothetical protein